MSKPTTVNIPLSALRCILHYPKEQKLICEIHIPALKKINAPQTLDEIISTAHLEYALGNYKTFKNAKDLIADLHS